MNDGGTALLLVDLQKDFLARPGLSPAADILIGAVAGLLQEARGRGWRVVHVQTHAAADGSNWMPHWREGGRAYCLDGTDGAEPPPGIVPAPGERVFAKSFFSAFGNDDLAAFLRAEGVETLVVAGVHTHACIRATVTDAYARGFDVIVPREAVASYDPLHADLTLSWIDGRAARCVRLADLFSAPERPRVWQHRNPANSAEVLAQVPLASREQVFAMAAGLAQGRDAWAVTPIEARAERLRAWRGLLAQRREQWIEALGRDVGKPRADAEGEIAYGLGLLDRLCDLLADTEEEGGRIVRYRPLGLVGLITPWNNPFAIPIGKIAPALGFGNVALWKPALPAAQISGQLLDSLAEVGLGRHVALALGDGSAGEAVVEAPGVAAVSFTGSVAVGRAIVARCGRLGRPVQAELGGNNAAIVLADADVAAVAEDLAPAMFSFAGQRCTAIRRIIVEAPIFGAFAEALKTAAEALPVGDPVEAATAVGPVISIAARDRLLAEIGQGLAAGGRLLCGGKVPRHCSAQGAWIEPTIITGLPPGSPIVAEEQFGPLVSLSRADGFDAAIAEHNRHAQGLLGAIYTSDESCQARFLAEAEAGILTINRARPLFSVDGPFFGWKASGFGVPEHGRWNRDFYTRAQALYRS